jgi:hypothetical protein
MAFNKVTYKGNTIMDISDSTVTPETLIEGAIAYGANGEKIVGTATGKNDDDNGVIGVWTFNDYIYLNKDITFNVNFVCDGETYSSLRCDYESMITYYYYDSVIVHESNPEGAFWSHQKYRVIEITGGDDVTNPDFIKFLTSYAKPAIVTTYVEYLPNDAADGSLAIVEGDDKDNLLGTWEIRGVFDGMSYYKVSDAPSSFNVVFTIPTAKSEFQDKVFMGLTLSDDNAALMCCDLFDNMKNNNWIPSVVFTTFDSWETTRPLGSTTIKIIAAVPEEVDMNWLKTNAMRIPERILYSRENGEWVNKGIIE